MPTVRMVALRYRGLATDRVPRPMTAENTSDAPLNAAKNIVALYDREKRIIYLPGGGTGRTPTQLSVLVHEMVHHLQNAGGVKYDCPGAPEKPAYAAHMLFTGHARTEKWASEPLGR